MEHEGEGREQNRQPRGAAQQPQPNQRCPRCDSLNTKFCYFNNYSLSQPRHFCRACKRYWTQGGTFRNIPVGGGGSRKGKRAKASSSSSFNPYPQPQPNFTSLSRPCPPTMVQSTKPYYQLGAGVGGGYLSSLAPSVHSMNPSLQPFRNNVTASSNPALLSAFNTTSLLSRFDHMGNRDRAEQGLIPSAMANTSVASHSARWPQSLLNNNATNHRASSDASLWSTVSTISISGNSDQNNVRGGSSSSLIPNRWPDLPGFGPPQ